MLSMKESAVMTAIYTFANGKTSLLISPADIISACERFSFSSASLTEIINALSQDKYIDFVYTDRHGEEVYCINLLEKGKGFLREKQKRKRNLIYRLCLTVGLAVVSFIVGVVLKAIF